MYRLNSWQITGILIAISAGFTKGKPYDGSYFVLNSAGDPLVSERLDPLIFPGQTPSPHTHDIQGADTFSADWSYDKALKSTCNNMGPKKDHSNYWYPALYHHGADGQYTKVPSSLGVYYHFDTKDNGPRTMFKPGQKIIAGNPMLRHDDSATSKATKSIQWWCHGPPSGPDPKAFSAFPEGVTSCGKPYAWPGFSAEIWFPFCSDDSDEEFDPAEPYKHVTYGTGDGPQGGKCPETHPIALPQLFMEFHYNIEQFKDVKKAEKPWVLAPGDPTGSGMHADFINGWEDGPRSLAEAIQVDPSDPTKTKCNVGESGGGAGECVDLLPDTTASNCKISQSRTEDVVGPFPSLPGCNPEQAGPGDAVVQTGSGCVSMPSTGNNNNATTVENTDDENQSPSSQAASQSSNIQSPPEMAKPSTSASITEESRNTGGGNPASIAVSTSVTWTYQGCYSDLVPDRNVRALETWGTGKTSTECATHCASAGFSIAGTEYGAQCFCGNALNQSKKLEDSKCDTQCKGSTETCGGNSALSVYAAEGANLGLRRREHYSRHHHHLGHHGRSA